MENNTPHQLFFEELLSPLSNKNSAERSQMYSQHLTQMLVLDSPTQPKVFTRFENQLGEISSSFRKSSSDYKIISILERNQLNKTLVVQTSDNKLDIIEIKNVNHITENYGFELDNNLDKYSQGDIISKDTILYKSKAHDDLLNFRYGVNLRATFLSWENKTYEDGNVISEAAAKKLSYTSVDELYVTVNNNDILLNLYGDDENYKCFPSINEEINTKILCSRRRIDYKNISNFSSIALKEINEKDVCFYVDGTVVDIEIYSNTNIENLKDNHNKQILDLLTKQNEYHQSLINIINENPHLELTDEATYIYGKSLEYFKDKKWYFDGEFDFLVIKFTVKKSKPAGIGSKVTNRCGNKGVISEKLGIKEDDVNINIDSIRNVDKMPFNEDGPVDIILNPLSPVNRLIMGSMYEHEINFIVTERIKQIKNNNLEDFFNDILELLYDINKVQYKEFMDFLNTLDDISLCHLKQEIIEEGLYIHQPPFFGNVSFEDMRKLYKKYNIYPSKLFYRDDDNIIHEIENPIIVADIYILHLKHQPLGKMSARSIDKTNIKGVPSKSKDKKLYQSLHSTTPVRVGEMELMNLLAFTKESPDVLNFINNHSSNEEYRDNLAYELTTGEKIENINTENMSTDLMKAYLQTIGLELRHSNLVENENVNKILELL